MLLPYDNQNVAESITDRAVNREKELRTLYEASWQINGCQSVRCHSLFHRNRVTETKVDYT